MALYEVVRKSSTLNFRPAQERRADDSDTGRRRPTAKMTAEKCETFWGIANIPTKQYGGIHSSIVLFSRSVLRSRHFFDVHTQLHAASAPIRIYPNKCGRHEQVPAASVHFTGLKFFTGVCCGAWSEVCCSSRSSQGSNNEFFVKPTQD